MKYFAYGSNMSSKRLAQRAPHLQFLGRYYLPEHQLRFHKHSSDGSGKCDAFYTGNGADGIWGALYELNDTDKKVLDLIEGLGMGYNEKSVKVYSDNQQVVIAMTYYATDIIEELQPYSWYLQHVLVGAKEIIVPDDYLQLIDQTRALVDLDEERADKEWGIYLVDA